jgi:hypothetical protein
MSGSPLQKLLIPFIGDPLSRDLAAFGSTIREKGAVTAIDKINWMEYPYKPIVQFFAGYSNNHLWLQYEVENDFFRAKAIDDQGAVWEDSCVEFFMSGDDLAETGNREGADVIYRNFEFNALGICLSAYGTKREREFLTVEEMNGIMRFPGLAKQNLPAEGTRFNWELSVAIPLNLLGLKPGSSFKANLYKCGDLTSQPHFLSWNCIDSESPDFHLPRFFGEMELVI